MGHYDQGAAYPVSVIPVRHTCTENRSSQSQRHLPPRDGMPGHILDTLPGQIQIQELLNSSGPCSTKRRCPVLREAEL